LWRPATPLDVIVLDLMMPLKDDWTFLARCKTHPVVPRRTNRLVAVSAYALRSAAEWLRVVLAKPFDQESLIGTVQAFAPLARPEASSCALIAPRCDT
jgi:CheY-like chemotaxis protein